MKICLNYHFDPTSWNDDITNWYVPYYIFWTSKFDMLIKTRWCYLTPALNYHILSSILQHEKDDISKSYVHLCAIMLSYNQLKMLMQQSCNDQSMVYVFDWNANFKLILRIYHMLISTTNSSNSHIYLIFEPISPLPLPNHLNTN